MQHAPVPYPREKFDVLCVDKKNATVNSSVLLCETQSKIMWKGHLPTVRSIHTTATCAMLPIKPLQDEQGRCRSSKKATKKEEEFRVQRGQEEEQTQQEPEHPPADTSVDAVPVQTDPAVHEAKSRKMLSSSTTTPDWLKAMFPMPADEIILSHVIHKTSMLPHFQVRMVAGDVFDGKCLCFLHNPISPLSFQIKIYTRVYILVYLRL